MDPIENVKQQMELAGEILTDLAEENTAERLAELVEALHRWRLSGGFDPYTAPFVGLRRF